MSAGRSTSTEAPGNSIPIVRRAGSRSRSRAPRSPRRRFTSLKSPRGRMAGGPRVFPMRAATTARGSARQAAWSSSSAGGPIAAWSASRMSAPRAPTGRLATPAASEEERPRRQKELTTTRSGKPASSRRRRSARAPSTTTHPAALLPSATRAMRRNSDSPSMRASCLAPPKRCEPPAASRITQGRGIIDGMRKEYASLRRRPLLAPVWLAALAGLLVIALGFWLVSAASTTTVFVMRHGEKLTTDPKDEDPALAPAGEARALELAQLFGRAPRGSGLDAIFVSEFRRTQDTVGPLANRLGVPVIRMPADDPEATARRALAENRGGRVLIVGHSDSVPEIVQELSGIEVGPMSESEYGILYVVTVPRFSRAAVTRLDFP
jgi:phosphohistidine phosphatase SixA